jgi:hypothetical protein
MSTLYKPSIYQSDNLVKMAGPSPAFEHIDDWEPHPQEPAPPPNSSHNLKIRWVCILGPSSFSAFSMVSTSIFSAEYGMWSAQPKQHGEILYSENSVQIE